MVRYTNDKNEYEKYLKMCKEVSKIEHDGHVERCFIPDGQIIDDCMGCPLLVIYEKEKVFGVT